MTHRPGAIAALALLLAGCSSGLHSDSPATQVYVLRTSVHPRSDLTRSDASLHVSRPMAGPGLDSDHILLVESNHRMSYYVASRWPDVLPAVVEALTVEALRSSGAWSAVQGSSSVFSSDYLLQIAVRDLEHFSRFLLDRLLNQAGVADVNSSFVLRTVKAFRGMPMPVR